MFPLSRKNKRQNIFIFRSLEPSSARALQRVRATYLSINQQIAKLKGISFKTHRLTILLIINKLGSTVQAGKKRPWVGAGWARVPVHADDAPRPRRQRESARRSARPSSPSPRSPRSDQPRSPLRHRHAGVQTYN